MRPDTPIPFPNEYHKIYDHSDAGFRWVRRGDIPGYFTETLYTALNLWVMWKRFGLPHGRGWLHESELTLQAIRIVDEERSLFDTKEREPKNRGNR